MPVAQTMLGSAQEGPMRTTIAISLVGLVLTGHAAAAQTPAEQAQIMRDFEQRVVDYTRQPRCLPIVPRAITATTRAPQIFTLPVAMVFRQLIAGALTSHGEPAISGVRGAHRATVLEPFPGTELYEFPQRLADALPKLPAPLEYRLIVNDLVIRDTQADVIVAVLRDAVGTLTRR
jgi:hypothetical protein